MAAQCVDPTRADSRPRPADRDPHRLQFGLKTVVAVVTGLSILFALLHSLGTSPGAFVMAFIICISVAQFAILCVEGSWQAWHGRPRFRLPASRRRRLAHSVAHRTAARIGMKQGTNVPGSPVEATTAI